MGKKIDLSLPSGTGEYRAAKIKAGSGERHHRETPILKSASCQIVLCVAPVIQQEIDTKMLPEASLWTQRRDAMRSDREGLEDTRQCETKPQTGVVLFFSLGSSVAVESSTCYESVSNKNRREAKKPWLCRRWYSEQGLVVVHSSWVTYTNLFLIQRKKKNKKPFEYHRQLMT